MSAGIARDGRALGLRQHLLGVGGGGVPPAERDVEPRAASRAQ